ncbi:MAG: sigma-54-dependent Fis family transcriptional regulator [Deltaproteobacteria bacterium]|nr:sigma-54-dependent Fis family transcriptional regulator [Deltaproteobacteria bacterium]
MQDNNSQPTHVLVIDDECSLLNLLSICLKKEGMLVETAQNGSQALSLLSKSKFDVAIVDLNLPDIPGTELIQSIKNYCTDTEIIVITGQATLESAIIAVKSQVFDYVCKPIDIHSLTRSISHAAERRNLIIQNHQLLQDLRKERHGLQEKLCASTQAITHHISACPSLIGESQNICQIRTFVAEVAPTDMTVLVRGESGTGKEIIANLIHEWSGRDKSGHFVKVNCPAISEMLLESEMFGHEKGAFTGAFKRKPGRFEFASGGTIFLDEIGSITLSIQAKLLQVIEHKQFNRIGGHEIIKVDVRIIAATNENLDDMIAASAFRADLFYRLKQFTIQILPLRERQEDIPLLCSYFLEFFGSKYNSAHTAIPQDTLIRLQEYLWPGNVRELKAIIERFVLTGKFDEFLRTIDQTATKTSHTNYSMCLNDNEIRSIKLALSQSNWNRRKAATLLGISYSTLRRKIHRHKIRMVPD